MKLYRGTLEKPIVFPESVIITAEKLSDTVKDNFGKAFDFIGKNFIQSSQ